MAEGITHGRVGVGLDFMELVCESGEVFERKLCKKARKNPSMSIVEHRISSKKITKILFPDEGNDENFRDSQIVPVLLQESRVENEFKFLEEAASVPIIRSKKIPEYAMEGLHESKLQVQRSCQTWPITSNSKIIRSHLVKSELTEKVNIIPNGIKEGIVPKIGNKPNIPEEIPDEQSQAIFKSTENPCSSSACSLGASNDVSCTFGKGYEGSDERSDGTSVTTEEAFSPNTTKRYRFPEDHYLSERRKRSKINKKMSKLQKLIPNCNKVDKASVLDEAIHYLKMLQFQIQYMQMVSLGNGFSFPQMMRNMQQVHEFQKLVNSSPLPNFPIPGIAAAGMTDNSNQVSINMPPNSFSQQPIIPNFLGGQNYTPACLLFPRVSGPETHFPPNSCLPLI